MSAQPERGAEPAAQSPRQSGRGLPVPCPQPPGCPGHTLTVAEPVRALLGHLLWKRGETPVRATSSQWGGGRGQERGLQVREL